MNIVHIIPGSGGSFYCENCVRDSNYLNSLKEFGHKVTIVPMYLPLFMDEKITFYDAPVFYGAVNLYLKQKFPVLKKLPKWTTKLLDSRSLLKFAAKKAGSTRTDGLEDMTISMLLGEDGNQNKELDRLIEWLRLYSNADIIHLSNALLLGLAKKIKEELNIPVVCSLQDENDWVDEMKGRYSNKAWQIMSELVKYVDAFIPVSDFYSKKMQQQINIPSDKLHTIYIGIEPDVYKTQDLISEKQTIGYLSRMSKDLGLDILADAFILLKQKEVFKDLRLHITGGQTGDDKHFIAGVKNKLKKADLLKTVEFFPNIDENSRIEFLQSLSLLSVPVKTGKAFGLFQLEAMSAGVPLVLPDLGAFSEIINPGQAGILYSPNNAEALAEALENTLNNKVELQRMSLNGIKNVKERFNTKTIAKQLSDVYSSLK